jgi:Asp-tRNA(Asn)/Glu-tRNA(Gln) amidotransferase A subunit family amidase
MDRDERRGFLMRAAAVAAAAGSLAACRGAERGAAGAAEAPATPPAAPPAGGGADADAITAASIAEAEKLAGIRFTDAERAQLLRTVGELRAQLAARVAQGMLPNDLPPAEAFRAALPGRPAVRVTAKGDAATLPMMKLPGARPTDDALRFATIPHLAALLRAQVVTSEQLTTLALDRFERLNPRLNCAITVMREPAMAQARAMDAELRAGRVRGPLHGIPYAAKDLFDTAGVRTTWGAEPWRDRVPTRDAWVVQALARAGAVLTAKTAVGALAYGDIWFGGTCRNPWNTEQGSSGSSAGSASAVAAGIVPFALGTETLGSIVSPCTRCGVSGLRPTFGRVPRTGCMSLSWSMDKVGTIARSAADCGVVLGAINGQDDGDPSSVAEPFTWSMDQDARGLRVGYVPAWFEGEGAAWTGALDALRDAGATLVPLSPPAVDPTPLTVPLVAEAAACFEDLTRSNADDTLAWQADEAWPNTFRQAWFIPAIEMVQASRLRRRAMEAMHAFFGQADAFVCPPFAGGMLTLTNATGQPCAVARCGFEDTRTPRTVTVMARLFDEGTAIRVAQAIEDRLGRWDRTPDL